MIRHRSIYRRRLFQRQGSTKSSIFTAEGVYFSPSSILSSTWYVVQFFPPVICLKIILLEMFAFRFFSRKSTKLDGRFAPAWIGFGNAFAAQEETDQAVSAYRTAMHLFQGSHLALLYIGETSNQTTKQPKEICKRTNRHRSREAKSEHWRTQVHIHAQTKRANTRHKQISKAIATHKQNKQTQVTNKYRKQ